MASFDGGVPQYLTNAAPGLVAGGYPLTFACWFNFSTLVFQFLFVFTDTGGATTHRLDAQMNDSSGHMGIAGRTNASSTGITTNAMATGQWGFGVWRWISDVNRRLSILFPNGTIEHVQNTVGRTCAGLDQIRIGTGSTLAAASTDPMFGQMSKAWYADADIQADGGQLSNATLIQLARYGPSSLPHLQGKIVELADFSASIPPAHSNPAEHLRRGPISATTWTNTGGVRPGPHAPHPYSYYRPQPVSRLVTI